MFDVYWRIHILTDCMYTQVQVGSLTANIEKAVVAFKLLLFLCAEILSENRRKFAFLGKILQLTETFPKTNENSLVSVGMR